MKNMAKRGKMVVKKSKTGVKKRVFRGKMGAIGLEENTSIQPK